MSVVAVIHSQGPSLSFSFPTLFLVYFTISVTQYWTNTDFYSHVSLVNNIAIEDKLEIVEEVDSFSSIEASVSEFGEIITAKKNSHRFEEYVNKACQANFDKINIENCHGSGCLVLQNKKLVEEIKFFRQQINEKNFNIRSLFPLKLPHREEDHFSYLYWKKN